MSVFDLDPEGAAEADADVTNVVTPWGDAAGLYPIPVEKAAKEAYALHDQPPPESHGFFYKVLPGGGLGIMRGGARVPQFLGMAGAALLKVGLAPPVESDLGPLSVPAGEREADADALLDGYFRRLDKTVTNAVDFWTPRAGELGTAGRILGGLGEMALPLMAGGGNPALLTGTLEMGTATDLVREGVSAPAAVAVGGIQGAANAVGLRLAFINRMPFIPSALVRRMLGGAAENVLVNTGGSAASAMTLKLAGEPEAARQFNPMDAEARVIDILMGAAFGAAGHMTRPGGVLGQRPMPHEYVDPYTHEIRAREVPPMGDILKRQQAAELKATIDADARMLNELSGDAPPLTLRSIEKSAVLTAANARHFQEDTAPGIPVDINASVAHQKAMESATRQLLTGDRVTAPARVSEVDFVPREFVAKALDERRAALDEHMAGLDDALRADHEALVAAHARPPEASRLQQDLRSTTPAANVARLRDFVRPVPKSPEEERLASVLERNPDMRLPTGALDEEGNHVTKSVRELIADADAEIIEAKRMGRAVVAAVNCFIQLGAR